MGPFGTYNAGNKTRNGSSWYENDAYFVYNTNPWFYRGATYYHGTSAGLFYFANSAGGAHVTTSFRISLIP